MTTAQDEIRRRRRTADMMVSIHSALRDRYARYATALDLVMFAGSVLLTATVLLDPRVLSALHISDDVARIVIGTTSVVMFFLSILSLRVDWKEQSAKHQRAARVLSDVKAQGRRLGPAPTEAAIDEFVQLYDFAMAEIEPIPEADFVPLKARHQRKVALSRALDDNPGVPVRLLQLQIFLTGLRTAFVRTGEEPRSSAS